MSWSWSDIFLPSTSQSYDEGQANLAAQQDLYRQRLAARESAGTISPSQDASYTDFISSVHLDNQNAAAAEGFTSGLSDSFNGLVTGGGSLLSKLSPSIWGIVVLAGIGLFIWAGGLGIIKGILARRASA
jgi:hypothetical protein